MYAQFDIPTAPRSRRRRWIAAATLAALAGLAVVAALTAPDSAAGPRELPCAATTSPSGLVTGSGPGDASSGPAAILGFNYAYYVHRSADRARQFLTAEAAVKPGDWLQAGIDAVPADTRHCVTISPLDTIGDTDLWAVTVTEYHPHGEPFAPRQIITTRTVDGQTRISPIARA
ncbi:hypothetical protein [Nocardia sp. NPDC050717]|uniref:hypothetical protein n=1 Tax=Nocardia sp. NPDC050717 TaxID=3157221 RepID=UPI0033D86419